MLSELLLHVYEPLTLAEYRPRMLECIGRVIENKMLCHNEINAPGGSSLSVLRPTIENFEPMRAVFFKYAHQHPSLSHLIATGDERAVKTSDFVSQRDFRSRGIYQEFYRKLQVRYQLTFGFQADNGALAFVAVSRWERDFTEQERAVLSLFRPHFIQAYRRAAMRNGADHPASGPCAETNGANGNAYGLTVREREVLHWLTEGKTNQEIACVLNVGMPTVKTHLCHIFTKLQVDTRTAACRTALAEELTARG